jgi:hypothetical protein
MHNEELHNVYSAPYTESLLNVETLLVYQKRPHHLPRTNINVFMIRDIITETTDCFFLKDDQGVSGSRVRQVVGR